MKSVPFVPDFILTDIYGDPITTPQGVPIFQVHARFLLERCADPTFAGSKSGVDAIEFVIAARAEIRGQEHEAESRGCWLLEDERAAAFTRATLQPANGYRPDIQHNLKPYMDAAKAMADVR